MLLLDSLLMGISCSVGRFMALVRISDQALRLKTTWQMRMGCVELHGKEGVLHPRPASATMKWPSFFGFRA
jgi:hypothetical protein